MSENLKYKPHINTTISILLSAPLFRFKFLKKKVGDKMWSHCERSHWKLEIAYSKNKKTNQPDWFDVADDYFYDDGEGNGEVPISLEEYKNDKI
jgi:hypothetical protein